MSRALHSPRPSPYYIYALDYRRTSAGIRVLHALCDALMRSGHEAYVRANVLNPALMTPRLTEEVIALHREQGVEPIVVYPEVIGGNPLLGNVVVRYLLNRPGLLQRSNDEEFGADDIIYAFSRDLQLPGQPDDQVMFMPPFDRQIFRMPDDPARRIPGKICYYLGRGGQGHIAAELLRGDSVEITQKWPACWEDMAALFQECEYFYCTESSALAGEAALCGCVSVVLPNQWAPKVIGQSESKGYGVAWGLEPQQLEWARATLPLLQERMVEQEHEFWVALDAFITVTQKAVTNYRSRPRSSEVERWLAARALPQVQRPYAQALITDGNEPSIQFVVLDTLGDQEALQRTLDSVDRFDGPGHELLCTTVASDLAQLNEQLQRADARWFSVLRAGETLIGSGLQSLLLELASTQGLRGVFGDAVLNSEDGGQSLLFRPDMNLDLLLSCPLSMARNWVFERATWENLGGFCLEHPQGFEFHYILRLIESGGLSGLGHVSEPLVSTVSFSLQDNPHERALIEQHLRVRGFDQGQVNSLMPGCYALDYRPDYAPSVSILVVVDGRLAEAQRCVDSLLENTPYDHYELLLLDRGNQESTVQSWLSGIEQLAIENIRVLRYPAEVSEIAIRNDATNESRGEYLLFLDAGIGIAGSDWLQQLVNHAVRPEVGVVGAKLVDGNANIAHAGLILGLDGDARSPYKGLGGESSGYMHRLHLDQNCSAVSDLCMMVSAELFSTAGGFDETLEPWADVDFSLRVEQLGYLNVWTPRTRLLIRQVEIAVPGIEQHDRLYERWLASLAHDPSYNRNLSLRSATIFKPHDSVLSWRPLAACRELPTVLVQPLAGYPSSQQRVIAPLRHLREEGLLQGGATTRLMSIVELERYQPDSVVFHRQIQAEDVQAMYQLQKFSRSFKIYDLDAFLPGLPKSMLNAVQPEQVQQHLKLVLACMDRVVVSNVALAQVFDGNVADIRVLEDRLEPEIWSELEAQRRISSLPRVGWVGRQEQAADFQVISSVIMELSAEVEWIVFGHCPEALLPYVHEVRKPVVYADYAVSLAELNLDLALAPLEESLFNRCKGNRRLLEYGACGYPVICSDLEPFHGDLPVTRVKNTHEAWIGAVRAYLADLDSAALLGDAFKARVRRDFMLEGDALNVWRDAWLPN